MYAHQGAHAHGCTHSLQYSTEAAHLKVGVGAGPNAQVNKLHLHQLSAQHNARITRRCTCAAPHARMGACMPRSVQRVQRARQVPLEGFAHRRVRRHKFGNEAVDAVEEHLGEVQQQAVPRRRARCQVPDHGSGRHAPARTRLRPACTRPPTRTRARTRPHTHAGTHLCLQASASLNASVRAFSAATRRW